MTTRALVMTVVLAGLALDTLHGQQTLIFRGGVDVVVVPVSVRERGRPVPNLTAQDFEVLDNGVPQQITSTSLEALPIDVTLLLDVSGSLQGAALTRFKSDVQKTADLLKPADRVRLMAFADSVVDVFGLQLGGVRLPLDSLVAAGQTSFCHALAAALTLVPNPDRPHLIFAFTDGIDTSSFLDGQQIVRLAEYASASMYIALVPVQAYLGGIGVPGVTLRSQVAAGMQEIAPVPSRKLLEEAAKKTGGAVYRVSATESLPATFAKVLLDYRTGYVLRYSPRGVNPGGWHDIAVKLTPRGNFELHARKGYEGS